MSTQPRAVLKKAYDGKVDQGIHYRSAIAGRPPKVQEEVAASAFCDGRGSRK
jgi:hypothetical protein